MKDASPPELIRIGFWSAVGGALFSATIVLALVAFGAVSIANALPSTQSTTRKIEGKATVSNCGCE
jgi:hypothetical protein